MRRLIFIRSLAGDFIDQQTSDHTGDDAIGILFWGGWRISGRNTPVFDEGILESDAFKWIWYRGGAWYIDFDALNRSTSVFTGIDWLRGVARVSPEIVKAQGAFRTSFGQGLEFRVFREELEVDSNRKIFLSHKGGDKPLIREYFRALRIVGFDPWLDEDAMVAGTPLERGILKGFEQSCAAVFFLTPSFEDENYLATEVEYAIRQKRKKGDRFSIISIVLSESGRKATVPPLLNSYVWKEPQTHLEAIIEIVRALPLEPGDPIWKGHLKLA